MSRSTGSTPASPAASDQATTDWAAHAEALGIDRPSGRRRPGRPCSPTAEHHALSPADVCPDNNLLLPDGCRLIDFEWAEVRHPAWDAAYLAVPWPTCWCSWRIPDASAERALDAYREAAVEGIPYVGDRRVRPTTWRPLGPCWALVHGVVVPDGPPCARTRHRIRPAPAPGPACSTGSPSWRSPARPRQRSPARCSSTPGGSGVISRSARPGVPLTRADRLAHARCARHEASFARRHRRSREDRRAGDAAGGRHG